MSDDTRNPINQTFVCVSPAPLHPMTKKTSKRNRPGRYYKRQLAFIISRLPLEVPVLNRDKTPLSKTVTLERYLGDRYIPGHFNEYLFVKYLVFLTSNMTSYYIAPEFQIKRKKYLTNKQYIGGDDLFVPNVGWNLISLETLFQVANNPRPLVLWLTQVPLFFREHPLCETRLLSLIQAYIH